MKKVETKRLSFEWDKLLFKNIVIDGIPVIKELTIRDIFNQDAHSQLAKENREMNSAYFGLLERNELKADIKIKRKKIIIFASIDDRQTGIIANFIFTITDNRFLIECRNMSSKKIYWGETVMLQVENTFSHRMSNTLKAKLTDTFFDDDEHLVFTSDNFLFKVLTTFNQVKLEKGIWQFCPRIFGHRKEFVPAWKVANSNKNYNAFVIEF